MKTDSIKDSLSDSSWWRGIIFVPLTIGLVGLALLPAARGGSPPPDGGYANQNTAEGEDALFSLTSGLFNTAIGFKALYSNTTGYLNTATGNSVLYFNTTGSGETTHRAVRLIY